MELKLITNPNKKFWLDFDKLIEISCSYTVQLNSIWLSNYIKYYFTNKQTPFIIAAYQDDNLVGCLPLQSDKKRATKFYDFTELRNLGFGPTDFFDIPVIKENKEEILSRLIQFLKKNKAWDKLVLTELPERSENVVAFLKILEEEKLPYKLDEPNGFAYIETNGNWEHFFKTKFNPNNKDLAKSERRIERQGYQLKFTSYRESIYTELLKNIDLYAQRRESLGQFNNYETDKLKQFLKKIIEAFEAKKMVELTVLESDGETWAFQLDYIDNKTRYHWNHAYNEDYKRYSPGKLILKELLKNSFQDPNIDYCNHMRGLSGYKNKFTEEHEMLRRIRIGNPSSKKIKLTHLISKILKMMK